MRKIHHFFIISITCIILITGLEHETANASKRYGWSPDQKVPGYLDDTFTPFLLADRNKTVHAFTSQWVENKGRRLAIVYRQWTLMGGWTRPVDIILSPTQSNANFMWAYMDSSDIVHVIFTATANRRTSVYYSSAPASLADWAPAWSAPLPVGDSALGLNSGAIVGDDQGNLVVIYSGNRDGSGVYYVHSKDSGATWSAPLPVFFTYDANLSAYSLRLTNGLEQKIRASWNVVTNLGVDEALYFASFDSQNSEWDTPVELDRRIAIPDYFGPSFPAIVDDGREVIVIYNSGNPFTSRPVPPGRPIQLTRISTNGGLTWNEPLSPFPFHVGRSGEHAIVLDGNGTPHTLFIQRIESKNAEGEYSIVGGVWHSSFLNGSWTNPERFVTTYAPHDVRAVVSQGNVLLAVWREDPGVEQQHGVWYSYTMLDSPELSVLPLATSVVDYSVNQNVTVTPFPYLDATPSPFPQADLFNGSPPSGLENNPALPIIAGIVPVLLILAGVIIGYRFLLGRNK